MDMYMEYVSLCVNENAPPGVDIRPILEKWHCREDLGRIFMRLVRYAESLIYLCRYVVQ